MADPFVGEIKMVGFDFAPVGWAFCNGALLPIEQNETLYNLIGTYYGGDGVTTFGLPDLRGRVPVHQGAGFILGEVGGAESVTLTSQNLPAHNHALLVGRNAPDLTDSPDGQLLGSGDNLGFNVYAQNPVTGQLNNAAVAPSGGSQPHTNMQPFLVLNYVIALFGIYPSQN